MKKTIYDKVKEIQQRDEEILRLVKSATIYDDKGNVLDKENKIYTILGEMCIDSKNKCDNVLVELFPEELERFYKDNKFKLVATCISTDKIKPLKCIDNKNSLVIVVGKENLELESIKKLKLQKAKNLLLSLVVNEDIKKSCEILVLTNKE